MKGASDVLAKLAKCCTPVPGDDIRGFVTKGQGVWYRTDCHNFKNLQAQQERVVDVEWAPTASKSVFLVQIQVEALDRSRYSPTSPAPCPSTT